MSIFFYTISFNSTYSFLPGQTFTNSVTPVKWNKFFLNIIWNNQICGLGMAQIPCFDSKCFSFAIWFLVTWNSFEAFLLLNDSGTKVNNSSFSCWLQSSIFCFISQISLDKLSYFVDMFKKHRQDCEHQKNGQFDIYAITSNFLNKFQWNFAKKLIIM